MNDENDDIVKHPAYNPILRNEGDTPQYHKSLNVVQDKADSGLLQALDSVDEGIRSYSHRLNELHTKLERIKLPGDERAIDPSSAHIPTSGSPLQDLVWSLSHRIANANLELSDLIDRIDL